MTDSTSDTAPPPQTRRVERGGVVYEQRQPTRPVAPPPVPQRQPVVDRLAAPRLPDDEFGPIQDAPALAQPAPQPRPIPQLPPDYRPGADPNIPPRVDALRKALDRLLSFDKEGPELLAHPGANLMQLSLLAEYTREMLEGWLQPEDTQPGVRTITVEALN